MRSLISFLFATLYALQAMACGVCGCSVSVGGGSSFPVENRSFVGVNYLWSQYRITDIETQQQLGDFIHRIALVSNVRLSRNWEVSAQLPYVSAIRNQLGGPEATSGVGDLSLVIQRTVFDNTDSTTLSFTHRLQAGLGIVMPTGKFEEAGTLPPGLSSGRGSWHGNATATYMTRKDFMGAMVYASYNFIPKRPHGYVPGNAFFSDLQFFQVKKWRKWTMIPVEGLHYEYFAKDISNNYYRLKTGGEGLYINAALRANLNRVSLQAGYEHPLLQEYSEGNAVQKGRFNFQINYFFKKSG